MKPTAADWLGVALLTASALLAALIEALLVPYYIDGVIAPLTIALAAATNVALPWLANGLIPRATARLAPFLAWLVVMIGFGVYTRPEGDVILPGGGPGGVQYVTYGVLLGGALVGTVAQVWLSPPPQTRAGRVSR